MYRVEMNGSQTFLLFCSLLQLTVGFQKPWIMFSAVINDMWQAPASWNQWKLNEVEIGISRCDNTPLWAHSTIIDALKHLISPAGNSKHRKNKLHEVKMGWLLEGKVCFQNLRALQIWQMCNIPRFHCETIADVSKNGNKTCRLIWAIFVSV